MSHAPWQDADTAMRPLWVVLALAAMTAACLGLACLAYAYHAATHPAAIHHAWGDPWTGPLP
jgi:hypothetical protein